MATDYDKMTPEEALRVYNSMRDVSETFYKPENPPEEYPVGTWLMDKHGGVTMRRSEGYGAPGTAPFGKWEGMWLARGPYVPCSPWGAKEKDAELRALRDKINSAPAYKPNEVLLMRKAFNAGASGEDFETWLINGAPEVEV